MALMCFYFDNAAVVVVGIAVAAVTVDTFWTKWR
jgi:hypothetical protein